MYTREADSYFSGSTHYGGGGGGILVNGRGPQNDLDLPYTGAGYGAGEGRCAGANPGVILVQVHQPWGGV